MNNDVMKGMVPLIGVVMIAGILQMLFPAPVAPTVYTCPVCGEQFATLAELETHLAAAHPAILIDITWQ